MKMSKNVDNNNAKNNNNTIFSLKQRKLDFKSNEDIDESSLVSTVLLCKTFIFELFLWFLTWPAPAFFIPLLYLTTGIIQVLLHIKGELAALSMAASIWSFFTTRWHSQQFIGLDNIPAEGAAILAWYHGPLPVDYWGLLTQVYKREGRMIKSVVDKNLVAYLPLSGIIRKSFHCDAYSKVSCVDLLDDGYLVGVAPGGARECMFDDSYNLMWGKRDGFAKVAVFTRAPIIPIFTENIREAYCTITTGKRLFQYIYSLTKVPMVPFFGGFPVQLITHIGTPIISRKGETARMLQERVKEAMLDMVNTWKKEKNITK